MATEAAAAAAQPAQAKANKTAAAAAAASASSDAAAAAPAARKGPTQLAGKRAGQSLWGPASRSLPLQSFSATPRVHTPPARTAPRQLARMSRLPTDDPNSPTVQLDLTAAVVVERWPKILKNEAQWKLDYRQHFASLRASKNLQHQVPDELLYRPQDEVDELGRPKHVAEVEQSAGQVDPAAFLTEADVARDLHATHRELQESLFLLIKKRGGGPMAGWHFPQAPIPFDVISASQPPVDTKVIAAALAKDTSPAAAAAAAAALNAPRKQVTSVRSVATDALAATVGTHAGIYIMGNAPVAVYRQFKSAESQAQAEADLAKRRAERDARVEAGLGVAAPIPAVDSPAPAVVGTKTFYMHALYMDGEIRLQNSREFEDYAWVKKTDLAKYIGKEPAELLQTVLLDAKA